MAKKLLYLLFALGFALPMMAQPINDDCNDAQTISSGEDLPFTTLEATTDGPSHPDDCLSAPSSTPDSIYNDIWYRYVADFTGEASFSLCGTANFDTKIAVYEPGSACPPTNEDLIACNEDGPGCENFTSSLTFDVEEGQIYLLRIGGYGSESPGEEGEGTFSIGESDPTIGPPNDICDNATEIILDDNDFAEVEFVSLGAGSDGPVYAETFDCFDVPNNETTVFNDVWFTWTATFNGWVEFSNCGTSNFDSRIAVYGPDESCPPDPFALVGCSDDGVDENNQNCPGFTSRAIFEVEEGATYLMSLGGWSQSDAGNGTVILQRTEPLVPPFNDLCVEPDSAWILSPQQADNFEKIFESFTFNAGNGLTPNPSCRATGEFQDVWYEFNSGMNEEITLRFNKTTSSAEFIVDLYSSCTTQADTAIGGFCLRTDSYSETYIEETFGNFPGTPTEYLLRVSTRITTDAPGEFWLQLVGMPFSNIPTIDLEAFRFFPNPVSGDAQVTFELNEATNGQMAIYNAMGQAIHQQDLGRLVAGSQVIPVPARNLAPGLYYMGLLLDEGQKTVKFVKQ